MLRQPSASYWGSTILCVAAVCVLSACAGADAYRQGQELLATGRVEQGLAKLDEASKAAPRNADFRMKLLTQRAAILGQLLQQAEANLDAGNLAEAERSARRVLAIEPENSMAESLLARVVSERGHREALQNAETLAKKGGQHADEAVEILRKVLQENPRHRAARQLQSRLLDQRARELAAREVKLSAAYNKPITLEFRDAPLRSIFDLISKASGLNFFFDKDVRPDLRATILARDTSIADAIRILLVTNQLEQKVLNDSSILIYPNTPQKIKDYQSLAIRTFYLTNADVKAVSNTLKTILKVRDLVIDERLGIIIMRDTPNAIRLAERLVELQDMGDAEVMLEVEVIEIKTSRLQELGIHWPAQATFSPLPAPTASQLTLDVLRNLNSSRIGVAIDPAIARVREEDTDSRLLANPRIRVRNKDKARILIGDRVPVITTTSTATGFVADSVSYVDVGLKLEVEPTVFLDDEVAIRVGLEVSNIVREVTTRSGTLSYQIGTRNANTVLRLRDGETQILGGLINDEDRASSAGIPGMARLPVLGRLFGIRRDDAQKTEIALSITPRIVRAIRRPDLVFAEFDSGTETNVGSAPLLLAPTEQPGGPQTVAGAASGPGGKPDPARADAKLASPAVAPSSPAPATGVSGAVAPIAGASAHAQWQGPQRVRVGEQFSVTLRVQSDAPIRGLPLLLGFDPQVLQWVATNEGDFLKQGSARTTFSSRTDPGQGRIFVSGTRSAATSGADPGINGRGSAATVTFRALKPGDAEITVLSVTPEPAPARPWQVPVVHRMRVEK
jgi:general secretion pathway protein D